MFAPQRRHQILVQLQGLGEVRTKQLSEAFGVSEVTIRSDLEQLERNKQLIRTHGGAMTLDQDAPATAFDQRMQINFDAKRRIAQAAARMIASNQSIVLDGGSTLLQLAMHMPPVDNVTVATNAMNVAQQLMNRPGIDLHMIGGRVFPDTVSTISTEGGSSGGDIMAHQVFVGAHVIDPSLDVVDVSVDIAKTKRSLIQTARRVILLADSSKWEIEAPARAFSLAQVDVVITDEVLPESIRTRLKKKNVRALYV